LQLFDLEPTLFDQRLQLTQPDADPLVFGTNL
jgi:hypothetical protein